MQYRTRSGTCGAAWRRFRKRGVQGPEALKGLVQKADAGSSSPRSGELEHLGLGFYRSRLCQVRPCWHSPDGGRFMPAARSCKRRLPIPCLWEFIAGFATKKTLLRSQVVQVTSALRKERVWSLCRPCVLAPGRPGFVQDPQTLAGPLFVAPRRRPDWSLHQNLRETGRHDSVARARLQPLQALQGTARARRTSTLLAVLRALCGPGPDADTVCRPFDAATHVALDAQHHIFDASMHYNRENYPQSTGSTAKPCAVGRQTDPNALDSDLRERNSWI